LRLLFRDAQLHTSYGTKLSTLLQEMVVANIGADAAVEDGVAAAAGHEGTGSMVIAFSTQFRSVPPSSSILRFSCLSETFAS